MSFLKYFAPPEWDNDVPRETCGENLTKKSKLKKLRKNDNVEKSNIVEQSEKAQFPTHEEKPSKKRKKESNEFKSKKKKNDLAVENNINKKQNNVEYTEKSQFQSNNKKPSKKFKKDLNETKSMKKKHALTTESYVKFESPKLDATSENVTLNETPSTPISKNSLKKKKRREQNGQIVLNGSKKSNLKLNNSIAQSPKSNKPIENGIASNVSGSDAQNSSEISWKTLKNRKRRSKKNKAEASIDSSKTIESVTKPLKKPKPEKPTKNNKIEAQSNIQNAVEADITNTSINNVSITKSNKKNKNKTKPIKGDEKNTSIKSKPKGIVKNSKLKHVAKIKEILKGVSLPNPTEEKPNDMDDSEILAKIDSEVEKQPVSRSKSLRERMIEKLKGARFRYLNEQMYLKQSNEAIQLFKEDPGAFQAYHDGYKQQINKWPLNPLDIIISDISKLPKSHIIADLGCGEARLAQSVQQKVHSFDLVALNPSVTACDMCHTPLLTAHVDVVVFCLSLMGTNLRDYLMEANRILKIGGLLKIAEVESRFENIDQFVSDIQKYGFSLIKKDFNNELFYFIDLKKENEVKKRNKLPQLNLNPCLYKKR
ncbi:uncharacterized protein LOC143921267 [Arctopsyche grandis]|uniref:uncharacterized protein LOC143921267 n=1 Tax=Arctopsyche grandis TaxID=121162 RepID=UPI00406D9F7A